MFNFLSVKENTTWPRAKGNVATYCSIHSEGTGISMSKCNVVSSGTGRVGFDSLSFYFFFFFLFSTLAKSVSRNYPRTSGRFMGSFVSKSGGRWHQKSNNQIFLWSQNTIFISLAVLPKIFRAKEDTFVRALPTG